MVLLGKIKSYKSVDKKSRIILLSVIKPNKSKIITFFGCYSHTEECILQVTNGNCSKHANADQNVKEYKGGQWCTHTQTVI